MPLKAYLSSDHVSDAASKTIAIVISKNGAGFGNPNAGATNATEVGGAGNGNGWYYVDLDATDTGTLGPLIVRGTVATIDPVEIVYWVANQYNMGLSALPNVAADGAGGLPISDAGGLDVDAIKAITDKISFTGAGPYKVNSQIQGTDDIDFPATMKASLDAATPASVQNISAQTGDTYAELTATIAELVQGIPTATPTIKQALMLPYMKLRNSLDVTSSLESIKNDAGAVITKAALSDDGTTFSKAKLASGP